MKYTNNLTAITKNGSPRSNIVYNSISVPKIAPVLTMDTLRNFFVGTFLNHKY